MRKSLLLSATILSLAAGPVLAQSSVGSTQSPPSPNSSSQPPQPGNSVPTGAATSQGMTPGSSVGTNVAPPMGTAMPMTGGPVVTAGRPMRNPRRANAYVPAIPADQASDTNAPPTSAYRGGVGSPSSTTATNLTPSNRLGARLPDPGVADSPESLLMAAQRALAAGRTGAAQEALERAETRILSRTVDPSRAELPDQAAMAQNVSAARRALGGRDVRGAQAAIAAALQAPVPRPGPVMSPPARTY